MKRKKGEIKMERSINKTVYFIGQIVWSLIYASVFWYLVLKNASFDFYGNDDNALLDIIIVVGTIMYLVLTFIQIVIGAKKVKEWKMWVIIVSLLVAVAVGFAGIFAAAYGAEFLNR